ncbi:MAG: DUF2865 domain-containing protein [Afipia sp.]
MHNTWSGPALAASAASAVLAAVVMISSPARAQDFFSALFGGFSGPPRISIPFGGDPGEAPVRRAPRVASGGGTAYCVRTCDGRYFPLSSSRGQSRAEACNSLCPASETQVFFGGSIDHAVSRGGKSYSQIPNAYRYRKELVAGCTCNGKDPGGLAHIHVEDDPTLRRGDLIAAADGSLVASRAIDDRGASADEYVQSSRSPRESYGQIPSAQE